MDEIIDHRAHQTDYLQELEQQPKHMSK